MAINLYKDGYNNGWHDGSTNGYAAATLTFLWLLHSECGWGPKRLSLVVQDAMKFSGEHLMLKAERDAKTGKYVGLNYDDMQLALEEECGLHMDLQKGTYYFTDKNGRMVTWERVEDH